MELTLYHYKATAGLVFDEDTVRFNIDLGLRTWRVMDQPIRLFGINAPELRGILPSSQARVSGTVTTLRIPLIRPATDP